MDVRAIILVGAPAEKQSAPDEKGANRNQFQPGAISGTPIALLPVLGRTIIARVADSLARGGVDGVTVLNAGPQAETAEQEAQVQWKNVAPENIWRAAHDEFSELAQDGAELVVVARMGAYAEIHLDELLQFHIDHGGRITQVFDAQGPLDLFVISSSRRNDAAHLFRTGLTTSRVPVRELHYAGYVNRLEGPEDFRRLTLDSLHLRTAIRPLGEEVRPGVWKGPGAKIEKGARIVAPAYIGAHSRVRASSLVTRGSAIEHHCVVGCGTAVDNSTVLPFSHMGPGLDLCDSILGFRQISSLKRKAVITVEDPRLVKAISQTASIRAVAQAAELISYLPRQMWRGFRGEQAGKPVSIAETTNMEMQHFDSPRVGDCAREDSKVFDSDLAVARRYGNQ